MSKTVFQKSKKALAIAAAATALLVSQNSLATILKGDYQFKNNRQGAQTLTWNGGTTATIKGTTRQGIDFTIEYHDVKALRNKGGNNIDWLVGLTGKVSYSDGRSYNVLRHKYAGADKRYALYLREDQNLTVHNWTPGLSPTDIHTQVTYVQPPQPPVPVPAPASLLLMGLGLAGVSLLKKKKK
ncbi:PEP-CTERM sorting domain-containing protein [Spartinivicinus ruber]|uniref:PEP-CTERM sorting domain-containing protein n=1 Tax=Spartinivicinus ruber TaxID=2683272 RepID=UPI0013D60EBA|nr:PEP-CTERM sorting domain-containing protein [Spartinivicinus ruber]